MNELDRILNLIESSESASLARKDWAPKHLGEIDIRIGTDGTWYHEGRVFKRPALVKLFASVLRREDDLYYLVTPAEKLRIEVEDAPFIATILDILDNDRQQALVFTTNLGDKIVADDEHAIRVEVDPVSNIPRPYIHFRDNLEALISRNVFFELLNIGEEIERDGKHYISISSMGFQFELGCSDESHE